MSEYSGVGRPVVKLQSNVDFGPWPVTCVPDRRIGSMWGRKAASGLGGPCEGKFMTKLFALRLIQVPYAEGALYFPKLAIERSMEAS